MDRTAERRGKIDEVEKRLGEMFQLKSRGKSAFMYFTVVLSVAGLGAGIDWLTI